MKVFIAPTQNEDGKFHGVVKAFPHIWNKSILDVGCRSGKLKQILSVRHVCYCGLDIFPPADIIGNINDGLPFDNDSFDTVVALDVLEHIDNIYRAIYEVCRVSRKYVVISLPNLYEVKVRLRFLLSHTISAKYGLPPKPPLDRHRWLFSFEDARKFCFYQAEQMGLQVLDEGCLVGPKRGLVIGKFVVSVFPNLFCPHYLVLLGKMK